MYHDTTDLRYAILLTALFLPPSSEADSSSTSVSLAHHALFGQDPDSSTECFADFCNRGILCIEDSYGRKSLLYLYLLSLLGQIAWSWRKPLDDYDMHPYHLHNVRYLLEHGCLLLGQTQSAEQLARSRRELATFVADRLVWRKDDWSVGSTVDSTNECLRLLVEFRQLDGIHAFIGPGLLATLYPHNLEAVEVLYDFSREWVLGCVTDQLSPLARALNNKRYDVARVLMQRGAPLRWNVRGADVTQETVRVVLPRKQGFKHCPPDTRSLLLSLRRDCALSSMVMTLMCIRDLGLHPGGLSLWPNELVFEMLMCVGHKYFEQMHAIGATIKLYS